MRLTWRSVLPWALVGLLVGCAGVSSSPSGSPPTTGSTGPTSRPSVSTRQIDPAQAQRLQQVMIPLIKAMNRPMPLDRVRVAFMDDSHINAANAGGGEFYVTRGLLEKANDQHLMGVLAHEIAHEDLNHVAKAQRLGAGLNIGMVILDQIVPGSGALAPIAGQLIARGYSRKEEYQADAHGAELLKRIGSSKQVMIDTLNWLIQTEGSSPGGFFSTHPATAERIDALKNTP